MQVTAAAAAPCSAVAAEVAARVGGQYAMWRTRFVPNHVDLFFHMILYSNGAYSS